MTFGGVYRSHSSTGQHLTSPRNSHCIGRTSCSGPSGCGIWPSSIWPTASSASSRGRTWWDSTSRRSWSSAGVEVIASTVARWDCCRQNASSAWRRRLHSPSHWRTSTAPYERWRPTRTTSRTRKKSHHSNESIRPNRTNFDGSSFYQW